MEWHLMKACEHACRLTPGGCIPGKGGDLFDEQGCFALVAGLSQQARCRNILGGQFLEGKRMFTRGVDWSQVRRVIKIRRIHFENRIARAAVETDVTLPDAAATATF